MSHTATESEVASELELMGVTSELRTGIKNDIFSFLKLEDPSSRIREGAERLMFVANWRRFDDRTELDCRWSTRPPAGDEDVVKDLTKFWWGQSLGKTIPVLLHWISERDGGRHATIVREVMVFKLPEIRGKFCRGCGSMDHQTDRCRA